MRAWRPSPRKQVALLQRGATGLSQLQSEGHRCATLGLYPITVTDAGLASLSRIGTLRQLNLTGEATLTADGLASLSRLNRLAYLDYSRRIRH